MQRFGLDQPYRTAPTPHRPQRDQRLRRGMQGGFALSDGIAGTYAVAGILAGLLQRFRTGRGQFIDVSMLDCLFSLLFDEPLDGYERLRQGNRIMRFSPFNCYPTRDGAIVIGAGTEADWLQLLAVLGRQDLAKDANYMDRGWRVANNDMVDEVVAAWTRRQTKASALSELDAADIPCAPVNGVADTLKSEQLLTGGMLQPLRSPPLQDVAAVLAPAFP